MATGKSKQYVQCTTCGHVYQTKKLNIETIYINHECPKCKGPHGLNIGHDILDKYLYYDVTKDERYYI